MREGNRQRGSLWTGLVVVLALIAAACVVVVLIAGSRQSTARRGWETTLGPPDRVFARYPAREANEAARELERLAADLEIDIVPRHRREERIVERRRTPPGHPTRERTQATRQWVGDTLARSRLEIDEPPPATLEYVERYTVELEAVRERLLTGDAPEWERRLEAFMEAPVPNLLGLLELNRVLVADALIELRRGDEAAALRDLEASWRLASALVGEPEQIVNLIGMTIARQVAGVLRHVESPPEAWLGRLRALEPRAAVMESMLVSAWVFSQIDGTTMSSPDDGVLVRTIRTMFEPYAKMSMADLSERLRRRIERLQQVDPHCDADLDALGIGFDLEIPRWSIARAAYGPGVFGGVVERTNRLELDLELTARLIELRVARRANGGRWPARLPGDAASTACPDDRWSYAARSDGSIELGLDREPIWRELPPTSRGVLPTTVELR